MFTISVEDNMGLALTPDNIIMTLDDTPISEDDYELSFDPNEPGFALITFSPDILNGDHKLDIQVSDINANKADKSTRFRIAEEFAVEFVANHPNPFPQETTVVFQISDMAEKVDLDIYSVSGRHIRSYELYDVTGYHEIDWDGRDSDGHEIANGVYYLKFRAKSENETIERIERMARLR